jgi:hypothetical protein
MKNLRIWAAALIGVILASQPAAALPPYVCNTVATDSAAICQTVQDLYAAMTAGLPASLGAKTMAASTSVTIATDDARIGPVNETAPASDTASSGLNGREQRIAQNLTTINGKLPALGPATSALSIPVTTPSNDAFGPVVSVTRTNDTNVYAANDVIGAATGSTAALTFAVAPGAGQWMITSASLEIDAAAVISGETSYNLDCYSVTPPSALGDNVAWDIPSGDRASFQGIGEILLGTPVDRGSTLYVEASGINKQITTASGNIFCYLVTVGTYTPTASRVYVVTLHTVQM